MRTCSKCGSKATEGNPVRFINGVGICDQCERAQNRASLPEQEKPKPSGGFSWGGGKV